jgi:hypothetical protein
MLPDAPIRVRGIDFEPYKFSNNSPYKMLLVAAEFENIH